jgi:hypothetical protein
MTLGGSGMEAAIIENKEGMGIKRRILSGIGTTLPQKRRDLNHPAQGSLG